MMGAVLKKLSPDEGKLETRPVANKVPTLLLLVDPEMGLDEDIR
jgi:hypothetical protein